jgi:16S rRNA (cytosine1402-N4)-methyltransferase
MADPADHTSDTDARGREGDPLRFATDYHAPVLYTTVVDLLVTVPDGVYVDATLGGGGHTAALLDALAPEGRVIGIDQDADALEVVRARLDEAIERGRLRLLRGNFGKLERLLNDIGVAAIDGLLLDLGVSSHQFDVAARGFSFQNEAPLDMRMDTRHGITADEVVNRWSEDELRRVLHEYGEERRGGRIARAIVEARPIATTTELADVVRHVVPTRDEVKILARVFQGIRIAVNAELERLEQALDAGVRVLRPGGRMAVISYHSLEDRRVKRFFRYGNLRGEPVRDLYGNLLTPWVEVTRKPVMPDDDEVDANPRARSARLRVAQRRGEDEDTP